MLQLVFWIILVIAFSLVLWHKIKTSNEEGIRLNQVNNDITSGGNDPIYMKDIVQDNEHKDKTLAAENLELDEAQVEDTLKELGNTRKLDFPSDEDNYDSDTTIYSQNSECLQRNKRSSMSKLREKIDRKKASTIDCNRIPASSLNFDFDHQHTSHDISGYSDVQNNIPVKDTDIRRKTDANPPPSGYPHDFHYLQHVSQSKLNIMGRMKSIDRSKLIGSSNCTADSGQCVLTQSNNVLEGHAISDSLSLLTGLGTNISSTEILQILLDLIILAAAMTPTSQKSFLLTMIYREIANTMPLVQKARHRMDERMSNSSPLVRSAYILSLPLAKYFFTGAMSYFPQFSGSKEGLEIKDDNYLNTKEEMFALLLTEGSIHLLSVINSIASASGSYPSSISSVLMSNAIDVTNIISEKANQTKALFISTYDNVATPVSYLSYHLQNNGYNLESWMRYFRELMNNDDVWGNLQSAAFQGFVVAALIAPYVVPSTSFLYPVIENLSHFSQARKSLDQRLDPIAPYGDLLASILFPLWHALDGESLSTTRSMFNSRNGNAFDKLSSNYHEGQASQMVSHNSSLRKLIDISLSGILSNHTTIKALQKFSQQSGRFVSKNRESILTTLSYLQHQLLSLGYDPEDIWSQNSKYYQNFLSVGYLDVEELTTTTERSVISELPSMNVYEQIFNTPVDMESFKQWTVSGMKSGFRFVRSFVDDKQPGLMEKKSSFT